MKVLASYNIKGGVGKTAAAVNLAWLAAHDGARTLVWDLDPQGAATYYFRIKPKVKGGARGLLRRNRPMPDVIKGTDYEGLDLVPADFSYRNMDLVLDQVKHPARRLRKVLRAVRSEYDFVFLDCPPSISIVSESVFHAADALLVPTIPTTLSLRALAQLAAFCDKQGMAQLKILPFFSMVDRRKRLHRLIVENPPATLPTMLNSAIPYASQVERMGTVRAAVGSFASTSPAARAYESLWDDIRAGLRGS